MSSRKISINTSFEYDIPIELQIPMFASAGFSHISIGRKHCDNFNTDLRKKVKLLLNKHSLKIDTLHAPPLDSLNIMLELQSICEYANEMEIPTIVLHASQFEFAKSEFQQRYDDIITKCYALNTLAEKHGIRFALENVLPGPATTLVKNVILDINSKHIGFCYDSSHDQIDGPNPYDLLYSLQDHLIAVHLSDRIKEFVDHLIPGEGFIDFNEICTVIRNSNFSPPLLLEVMTLNSTKKDPKSFLALAYERGCELYDKIWTY